jgi:Domain of unknown function (DUF4192)
VVRRGDACDMTSLFPKEERIGGVPEARSDVDEESQRSSPGSLLNIASRHDLKLTTTGFVAWQQGNGALANVALDRALADDPRYSMASLLRQVIDCGAPPSPARLPMTPEEVAASYDDLEGPDTDDSTAGSAAMGDAPEGYDTYREHGPGGPLRLPAAES